MSASILDLLLTLIAILSLLLWGNLHESAGCGLLFVLMLPAVALIALNMLETALMRRRALVGMYLQPGSLLSRLLCRKAFLMIWQILKAVVLGFVLFVESTGWSLWVWGLLGLDLLLLYPAYAGLRIWLAGQVKEIRRNIVARRVLVSLNTLVLLMLLVVGQMLMPRTDYSDMSWQEAATLVAEDVQMDCDIMAPLVRLAALRDALTERLMVRSMLTAGSAWTGLGIWLLYFLWSGLVLWAWSRLLIGALGARDALRYLEERTCD
jgi:hypothetical protein